VAESEEWPGETETDVAAFAIDTVHDNDEYTIYRHMLGILEGSEELGNQFPLNCHMHTLNGVSFDKGCYIGQELT
jgi:folate-binding protein YgfZ